MASKSIKNIFIALFMLGLPSLLFANYQPRLIIDQDQRLPVLDTLQPPFRPIGQIGDFCTGSLIAPNIVLTAAHCIADIYNPYLAFSPAKNGSERPFGTLSWERIVVPSCYHGESAMECDFALIFLKSAVADITPFDLEGEFIPDQEITIAGYPSDKENTMWYAKCLATREGERLFYQCDTLGGMSGAPIIQEEDGHYKLIGIHTRGEYGINAGIVRHQKINQILDIAKLAIEGTLASTEITIFENPFLPQFEKAHTTIHLKNNCPEQIIAKTLFKDIRGNMSKKMRIIGKNNSKLLDQVYGPEVYISFQTKSGNFVSTGNELCGSGAAWPNCYIRYPINLEIADQQIELNCPK